MMTIIKYGLGAIIALFVIALFLDDEEETASTETVAVEQPQVAEENTKEEKKKNPQLEVEKKVPVANWGDGTVRKINASEYKKSVIDYTKKAQDYKGNGPCVVDFYATWCGPCKALAPRMEKLAKKYKGKIQFYKVDVDDNNALAAAYGIQSIPTLIFFKDGKSKVYSGAPYNLDELVANLAR